jgi:hypothetical protein
MASQGFTKLLKSENRIKIAVIQNVVSLIDYTLYSTTILYR